jgi:hypothetical protein
MSWAAVQDVIDRPLGVELIPQGLQFDGEAFAGHHAGLAFERQMVDVLVDRHPNPAEVVKKSDGFLPKIIRNSQGTSVYFGAGVFGTVILRNVGRKIATSASAAPAMPFGF